VRIFFHHVNAAHVSPRPQNPEGATPQVEFIPVMSVEKKEIVAVKNKSLRPLD
jgi:hypothetical protein